jgi:hypothetical protein
MRTKEALHAVYDDDLMELLEHLGVARRFEQGRLNCAVCGDVITWDNLNGLFPEGGQVKVGCTRPACVSELVERLNRQTV